MGSRHYAVTVKRVMAAQPEYKKKWGSVGPAAVWCRAREETGDDAVALVGVGGIAVTLPLTNPFHNGSRVGHE